jgi:hypothetical protein
VSTSGGSIADRTLPSTGTYTILVDPSRTATGSITLRLLDASDVNATVTPGGPAVTVTTTTAGQNARITFTGSAGQRVSLQLTNVTIGTSSCCSAQVSLINQDGSNFVAPTYFGTSGIFVDSVMLPASGTYTILLDPDSTNTGSATLTLYDVPPDVTGTITVGGAAVPIALATPGLKDVLPNDRQQMAAMSAQCEAGHWPRPDSRNDCPTAAGYTGTSSLGGQHRQAHLRQGLSNRGAVPVSDRDRSRGLSQSLSQFGLILKTRRDVRVVEGARLESDSGDPHRLILKHLFAQSIQRFTSRQSSLI